MSRVAYVNGRYLPHPEASVHVEDRGYQFADGVYEVIAVVGGRLVDETLHLDRLDRSLAALEIAPPMSRRALGLVMGQVLRRNRVCDGILYLQITRGAARRDHAFPAEPASAVVMTARPVRFAASASAAKGVAVITVPDIRWKRCDIKSVALLPNVLAKEQARRAGAYEAWLVGEDGTVTEGASTNAWIVSGDGETLMTRPADGAILNGVTRQTVIALARTHGLAIEERPFTVEEAKAAREAFLTSTTSFVLPVVRIDDATVADGAPGPLTLRLADHYRAYLAQLRGEP